MKTQPAQTSIKAQLAAARFLAGQALDILSRLPVAGLLLVVLALAAATGCASPESTPVEPTPIRLSYTACTTVTDSVPNFACADGQLSVTRCTQETENPNPAQCTGPVGAEVAELSKVWCCQ